MSLTTMGDAVIDDGPVLPAEVEIDQQYETVYSDTATTPDPAWTYVDPTGHFHAYATSGSLPTLTATGRHVPCDGVHTFPIENCDGYDVIDYTCRICRAPVEPGRVRQESVTIPAGRTWLVRVRRPARGASRTYPIGQEVTVRFVLGDALYFGIAVATSEWNAEHRGGVTEVVTTLTGIGELGMRVVPRIPMV